MSVHQKFLRQAHAFLWWLAFIETCRLEFSFSLTSRANVTNTARRYLRSHKHKTSKIPIGTWDRKNTSTPTRGCNSVLLLSYGRSATDTIAHTIVKSTELSYCMIKEYYGHGRKPSLPSLRDCFNSKIHSGGAFVHVKPEHIDNKGTFHSPREFMQAAHSVGFSVVIVSFRDNQLARSVSSFEMSAYNKKHIEIAGAKKFKEEGLIRGFEKMILLFNRCVQSAKDAGFRILRTKFTEIVSDVCNVSKRLALESGCRSDKFHCIEANGHMKTSHRSSPLPRRIGKLGFENVEKQLNSTPYEWMLDLDAMEWPRHIPRPVPVVMR